ncbi:AAEL009138-PA [Aedes aegypti]|uniref:AAEL009138-PA n=2 Tax=Aedes aegypti TaxID=7159 RepID=A0A1S4FLE5_AEDAE|nr:probable cytochrome P450 6a13 [Aedes aegypti]EAT39029.1 AAEL009138-PA [Aedes aegypti]
MLLFLLLSVVTAAYLWVIWRYSYWKRRSVPYVEPSFPFGNLQGLNKRHFGLLTQDVYSKLKGTGCKFGGMFFFVNPMVVILNLDFAKDVFVKDFQYFHDRGEYSNEKADPIMAHLVTMEGTKWKNLRTKLTPVFTSGKMKMMFPIITAVAEEFRKCMAKEADKGEDIEMKELLARFTTDVIGNCAFGLECNSLMDPEAEFRKMGRKAMAMSSADFLRRKLCNSFRGLAKLLGVRLSDPDVSDFFMNAVRSTIEYRERNKVQRNDLMDLLIKLKNAELIDEKSDRLGPLTFNEIAAQAFVFFLAGFESSSTAMSFCLYELAKNQELQDKARRNINEVLVKHGTLTYEALYEMTYIENCINESLRKYPPVTNIVRNVSKPYRVPGMNVTLEEDCRVLLPVYAIHHDPSLYPNPDQFDPERFNPENSAARHPMAFVPFGEGPRICIGLRFGSMQARIGLTYLLKNFRFTLSEKMHDPLKMMSNTIILASEGGLWMRIEKL